jgi:parvulin-like peptidyl-prolyl isomerase
MSLGDKKRTKKNKKILIYSLVFVLLALIIGGAILFSGNNSNINSNVIATVNGEEINLDEVEIMQQSLIQQDQQASDEEVVEQLINQKLISQEIEKKGISISNEDAELVISEQLSMQGVTLDAYKQQLSQQGISYKDQLDSLKENLATQEYLSQAMEGESLEVSEEEAQLFYENYKAQSQGEIPSYEEVKSQIVIAIEQEKQQEILASILQKLRENAQIEYFYENLEDSSEDLDENIPEGFPIENLE